MKRSALVGSCIRQALFSIYDATILRPELSNIVVSWVVIEPSLYLIVACLPGMYPMLNQLVSPRARRDARLTRKASVAAGAAGNFNTTAHGPISGAAFGGGAIVTGKGGKRCDGIPPLPPPPPPASPPPSHGAGHIPLVDGGFNNGDFDVEASGTRATKGLRGSIAARGASPDVLSASDWEEVTRGGGVLMTTEIIVTQEQRIEEVIGFRV